MPQKIKLVQVSTANNANKYYDMEVDPSGDTFTATYGRVGVTAATKVRSISKWDKVYRQKTSVRGGYVDNTELMMVETSETQPEADPLLDETIQWLSNASNTQVRKNYTLADAGAVTQLQIDEVNTLLGALADQIAQKQSFFALNSQMDMIRTVIPRKIKNVRDLEVTSYPQALETLSDEQDMVDALAAQSQVAMSSGLSVSASLGLTFTHNNGVLKKLFPDYPYIKDHDGCEMGRLENFWNVTHDVGEKRYQAYKDDDSRFNERLYFHGSRGKNWLSILNTGLMIRPPGVTTNGDMFGVGIYFADEPMKSLGYCDMAGIGRWAHGDTPRAYIAVFKVNTGKQFSLKTNGDYNKLNIYDEDQIGLKTLRPFSYDSLYVHKKYYTSGGQRIYNREFIIYETPRTTIAGFVEIRAV